MAAIAGTQISLIAAPGLTTPVAGEVTLFFRANNVTSGDTLDLSAAIGGLPAMNRIKSACWTPCGDAAGGLASASVLATIGNGATGANNKITFTLASMAGGTLMCMATGHV